MADGEKRFPLMLVIGLIVIGLILAGGISYFIAAKIAGDKAAASGKAAQREPGILVKLGDPKEGLIVNIGGVNTGRYLKIGIVLEMKPDKNAPAPGGKNLSAEEIKILDTVVHILRSRKIEEFDPAKQEQLKELIKNEVNGALGSERVYEVFITNFVLQ